VKARPDALEIRLGQVDTQLGSLAEAQARPANRVGAPDGRELEWRYRGPLGFCRIRVLSVVELPARLDNLEEQGLALDPADRDRLLEMDLVAGAWTSPGDLAVWVAADVDGF